MNNVNIEEIKNSLTIEQIFDLLYALNAEPVLKNNIIISRTICHGGDSHKLYYYDNTKLFRCYTQCENDTFDIFQLIIKLKENSNISFSLPQSINYICDFFGIVLERNNICDNTTKFSSAKITSQHSLIYHNLAKKYGITKAKQYLYSNNDAIKNIQEIILKENIECDFKLQDSYVFTKKEQFISKRKLVHELKKVYLNKKNNNMYNKKSRSLYAEAVNEVYNKYQ